MLDLLALLFLALAACRTPTAQPMVAPHRPSTPVTTASVDLATIPRGPDLCPVFGTAEERRAKYLMSIGGCVDNTASSAAPSATPATEAEAKVLQAALYCERTPLDECWDRMTAVWPSASAPYRYEVNAEGRLLGAWPLIDPPDEAVTCCARRAARLVTLPAPGHALTFDDGPMPEQCGYEGVPHGSLTKPELQGVIAMSDALLRQCYHAGLTTLPTLEGRVTLKFVVAPNGTVPDVMVLSNTTTPDIACCISRVARTWHFPNPVGGRRVIVEYPFVFERASSRH